MHAVAKQRMAMHTGQNDFVSQFFFFFFFFLDDSFMKINLVFFQLINQQLVFKTIHKWGAQGGALASSRGVHSRNRLGQQWQEDFEQRSIEDKFTQGYPDGNIH